MMIRENAKEKTKGWENWVWYERKLIENKSKAEIVTTLGVFLQMSSHLGLSYIIYQTSINMNEIIVIITHQTQRTHTLI